MKIEKTVEVYNLNKEDISLFKNKSGIYGLIYDGEVIYVGQSKNLKDRLSTHNRTTQIQNTIKAIIREEGKINRTKQLAMYYFIDEHREEMQFIILKETDELNKYEEHYISLFQPKYNYKGVDVPFNKEAGANE